METNRNPEANIPAHFGVTTER